MANTFSDDEIKALESEHRRVGVVPHEDGEYEYLLGPADKLQWRNFRANANDDDRRADAQEQLIKATVIAVAYKGQKAIGKADARKLFEELLADYVSATDGKAISAVVFKVNGQAGARSGK